ncbi:hypothetical protein DFP72DRAFT_954082 [Ephemerocybe angulata]|uniref:Fungal-type protein kinase domain-containing protein n=1 Tax=Ephemerocybe angulata TaxID=980116 RepID=A0A8H6MGF3_9AGAR|nr:hypothetical protein DFP72DRAFT_954082 [Tulosesus angulatus]
MPTSSTRRMQTRSQTRPAAQPAAELRLKRRMPSVPAPRIPSRLRTSKPRNLQQREPASRSATTIRHQLLTAGFEAPQKGTHQLPPAQHTVAEEVQGSVPERVHFPPHRDASPTLSSSEAGSEESDEAEDDKTDPAEQRKTAVADLHDIITVNGECLRSFYKGTVSDRRIKNFLTAASLYDYGQNSWTDVPRDVDSGEVLHAGFMRLIRSIINGLGNSQGSRDIVDTREAIFRHHDDSAQVSKPHLAIRATGPSFELPKRKDIKLNDVGFANIASAFDVKREAEVTQDDVDDLAVYNRQIFLWQPNRLFSRTLLLTEMHVRLLHCDRSGAYKTTPINIHDDPCTFVRLVLGLSSTEERVLGLDTNIQWTVKSGKKVAGTISTLSPAGKRVKYKLDMRDPYFATQLVRGRGTVCWSARDRSGRHILIKDAWRTDPQVPEYTFLERAKGLEGVVQQLAYEGSLRKTKDLRPDCFDFEDDDFYNRTLSRVTMVRYGASLCQFKSQSQAIAALRDAIQGHFNLLKAGVLHRDVSMDNVLFGEDGASVGNRGVIIDLDMAIMAKGLTAGIITELPAGTRLYQSICVLDYDRGLVPVPHDYLDDLESFFYVLCHLLHGYECVDSPVDGAFEGSAAMARWEHMASVVASTAKLEYIEFGGLAIDPPPLFWSSTCIRLCDEFRQYLLPLVNSKIKLRVTRDDVERDALARDLHRGFQTHYTDIIGLFDTALEDLRKPGGEDPRVLPIRGPSTPSPSEVSYGSSETSGSSGSSVSACSSGKRSAGDIEDAEASPTKRRHLSSGLVLILPVPVWCLSDCACDATLTPTCTFRCMSKCSLHSAHWPISSRGSIPVLNAGYPQRNNAPDPHPYYHHYRPHHPRPIQGSYS